MFINWSSVLLFTIFLFIVSEVNLIDYLFLLFSFVNSSAKKLWPKCKWKMLPFTESTKLSGKTWVSNCSLFNFFFHSDPSLLKILITLYSHQMNNQKPLQIVFNISYNECIYWRSNFLSESSIILSAILTWRHTSTQSQNPKHWDKTLFGIENF